MSISSIGTLDSYYLNNCWVSIEDMPIWNWNKICEEGSLIYLFKNPKDQKADKTCQFIWEELQQQHMNEFGVDDALLVRLKTMRKVIGLNIKFYETKDRSLLNLISIENSRIENMGSGIKSRFYKVLDYVSSYKGFQIDPKKFTVIEWYHALKNMETKHGKDNKGK